MKAGSADAPPGAEAEPATARAETEASGRDTDAPDTDKTVLDVSRRAPSSVPGERRDSGEDTMLSAPVPAEGEATVPEERFVRLEREVRRLAARVDALEARRPIEILPARGEDAAATRPLMLWLVALAILVGVWLAFGPDRP